LSKTKFGHPKSNHVPKRLVSKTATVLAIVSADDWSLNLPTSKIGNERDETRAGGNLPQVD